MSLTDTDVVILAGGIGSRLRSVIQENQKVVAKISGVPVIDYILDPIIRAGARRVVFALGYKAEQVVAHLSQRGYSSVELIPSIEDRPLGTAGALRLAMQHIYSSEALVLNGDSFIDVDYGKLLAFHRSEKAVGTLVTSHRRDVHRYGSVDIAENGQVCAFREKQESEDGGYVSAGVYVLNTPLISAIPQNKQVSLEQDVFPSYVNKGLFSYMVETQFIDIGTPVSYNMAASFFGKRAI